MIDIYGSRDRTSTLALIAVLIVFWASVPLLAEPRHGLAMYGEPTLPPHFAALTYVNSAAPKGGNIIFGERGSFNTLNPYNGKGRYPWGMRLHVFDSLMIRNYDEPFSVYGLLADSIEVGPNRDWVEFTMRQEAYFSDGTPVTSDDVTWSLETLGTVGSRRYRAIWKKVKSVKSTASRTVRIEFRSPNRELPLILGLLPILKKSQWQGELFANTPPDFIPIGSGPYVVRPQPSGDSITFQRDPNYWGRDLPINRGRNNFDVIQYKYFKNSSEIFKALQSGEVTTFRENDAVRWRDGYDFPAVQSGALKKAEIHHQRPSGAYGLVMNTRRELFRNWRVRQAMIEALNFEFINERLNQSRWPRISSYFGNSPLGMRPGPARVAVAEHLALFEDRLLPGALDGYSYPASDSSEPLPSGINAAVELFGLAGWRSQNGTMQNALGELFDFEIIVKQKAAQHKSIAEYFANVLKEIGIRVAVTSLDNTEYRKRTQAFDFDMAFYRRSLSMSPGDELKLYWGSVSANKPGSRNWMGIKEPMVDELIERIVLADNAKTHVSAVRALDRVLTAGRYVIPLWSKNTSQIAHSRELRYPERISIWGDWIGFQPDVWWYVQ